MCRSQLDIPGWLKPYIRASKPSPIILDSEGIGGVFEFGKFSDTAPKELRGRRLYTALMHVLLKPSESDPPTIHGATIFSFFVIRGINAPNTATADWGDCTDAYETCSPYSASSNVYSAGLAVGYSPYFLVLLATPASYTDMTAVSAYAKPCPVASSAYDLSGKSRMGDLKLRAWACDDSTNRLVYSRYVALDTSTNSYTIAGGALANVTSATGGSMFMFYMLPSSTSKGSGDVFQYIYQVAISYQ